MSNTAVAAVAVINVLTVLCYVVVNVGLFGGTLFIRIFSALYAVCFVHPALVLLTTAARRQPVTMGMLQYGFVTSVALILIFLDGATRAIVWVIGARAVSTGDIIVYIVLPIVYALASIAMLVAFMQGNRNRNRAAPATARNFRGPYARFAAVQIVAICLSALAGCAQIIEWLYVEIVNSFPRP